MWVLFVWEEMRLLMAEPKIIYCPICKRKAISIYGKTTFKVMGICKKCYKAVHYNPKTEEIWVTDEPARETMSGKTFW